MKSFIMSGSNNTVKNKQRRVGLMPLMTETKKKKTYTILAEKAQGMRLFDNFRNRYKENI
jgi:hypothetical protein